MNPILVIAGQSHLQSYLPAGTTPAEDVAEVPAGETIVLTGPLPRDDLYWSRFIELARGGTAAIVWGGDQHDIFLIERQPPLDFVLSTAPDLPLDPRASYVSESQLRAVFAPSFEGLAELIGALRDVGTRVLVPGTPPPIDDAEARAARAARDPRFAETFATGTPMLTSGYTMQKLWSLVQTITAEVAARAGAEFVAIPDRLRSADGFLPATLRGDDLRPAAGFGHAMTEELVAATGIAGDRK